MKVEESEPDCDTILDETFKSQYWEATHLVDIDQDSVPDIQLVIINEPGRGGGARYFALKVRTRGKLWKLQGKEAKYYICTDTTFSPNDSCIESIYTHNCNPSLIGAKRQSIISAVSMNVADSLPLQVKNRSEIILYENRSSNYTLLYDYDKGKYLRYRSNVTFNYMRNRDTFEVICKDTLDQYATISLVYKGVHDNINIHKTTFCQ